MRRIQLPYDETNPAKVYTLVDPESVYEDVQSARDGHCHHKRELTRHEIALLLDIAGDWLHLTTYELGQECCVGKLRDLWRARRARELSAETEGE